MAGLLSDILGLVDRAKQSAKANVGLLVNNPQEFAAQATARYFPTKEEENQFRAVEQAGGDITQTPYYQKLFNISQFQGSIKAIPKTQYDIAQEIAQKNATEMLGLPPNNTAMDRAKALGYDTPVFHGTSVWEMPDGRSSGDILAFDPMHNQKAFPGRKLSLDNLGSWVTNNPSSGGADLYARGENAAIYPLLMKQGNVWSNRFVGLQKTGNRLAGANPDAPVNAGSLNALRKFLSDANIDTVKIVSDPRTDGGEFMSQNAFIVKNPNNLRSRFAAFDPARVNESDLLAAGVPLGLLTSTQVEMPKKKQKKK